MPNTTKRLQWDQIGEKVYETGTRNGVLYKIGADKKYSIAEAWNGLIGVAEKPTGAEITPQYADDIKYLNIQGTEEFDATFQAYTYPDGFAECDGSANVMEGVNIGQQPRKTFGFSYVTTIGNDTDGLQHGYKLKLIWGCNASPSEKSYATINNNPEAITFSWEVKTTPLPVTGFDAYKPISTMTIDSRYVEAGKLKALEDVLYGTDTTAAMLPLPHEVLAILKAE